MEDVGRTLLRKKEVVEALGIAKSTVADWITEFQVFIPTVRDGATVFYKPESIEVLQCIKEFREQNYSKTEIFTMLQTKGFPLTVSESENEVAQIFARGSARETLVQVMDKVGTALERLADQDEAIGFMDKRQDALSKQQSVQDGRMSELEQQLEKLKRELAATREELESSKSRKRSWWPFGFR